jgi:hypothetical protein
LRGLASLSLETPSVPALGAGGVRSDEDFAEVEGFGVVPLDADAGMGGRLRARLTFTVFRLWQSIRRKIMGQTDIMNTIPCALQGYLLYHCPRLLIGKHLVRRLEKYVPPSLDE